MTKLRQLINTKKFPLSFIAMSAKKSVHSIIKYADSGVAPKAEACILIAKLFEVSPYWLWIDKREDIADYEEEREFAKMDDAQRRVKK